MSAEQTAGGAFGGAEELYREVILDHFKSPKNKGRVPNPTAGGEGLNPLCGDHVTLTVRMSGPTIFDIKFDGRGCAVSQAAASMMTALVKGKTKSESEAFAAAFKGMLGLDPKAYDTTRSHDELGDSVSLEGVKKYPVRVKCALLPWNTLLETLKKI